MRRTATYFLSHGGGPWSWLTGLPNHTLTVGAAADEAGACVYHEEDFFGGVTASSFRFG